MKVKRTHGNQPGRMSLHQCLVFLGAKRKDVYARHKKTHVGSEGNRGLYKDHTETELEIWVKTLHRDAAKRHQESEGSLKLLNVARQRAEHLIKWQNKGGLRQ